MTEIRKKKTCVGDNKLFHPHQLRSAKVS